MCCKTDCCMNDDNFLDGEINDSFLRWIGFSKQCCGGYMCKGMFVWKDCCGRWLVEVSGLNRQMTRRIEVITLKNIIAELSKFPRC